LGADYLSRSQLMKEHVTTGGCDERRIILLSELLPWP